ncbi:hypothetical protein Bbelb_294490 [Branchiostoma belcheri]|nr:hypothetical protein Bbelb_294490 [Branchiostoma belcheri]
MAPATMEKRRDASGRIKNGTHNLSVPVPYDKQTTMSDITTQVQAETLSARHIVCRARTLREEEVIRVFARNTTLSLVNGRLGWPTHVPGQTVTITATHCSLCVPNPFAWSWFSQLSPGQNGPAALTVRWSASLPSLTRQVRAKVLAWVALLHPPGPVPGKPRLFFDVASRDNRGQAGGKSTATACGIGRRDCCGMSLARRPCFSRPHTAEYPADLARCVLHRPRREEPRKFIAVTSQPSEGSSLRADIPTSLHVQSLFYTDTGKEVAIDFRFIIITGDDVHRLLRPGLSRSRWPESRAGNVTQMRPVLVLSCKVGSTTTLSPSWSDPGSPRAPSAAPVQTTSPNIKCIPGISLPGYKYSGIGRLLFCFSRFAFSDRSRREILVSKDGGRGRRNCRMKSGVGDLSGPGRCYRRAGRSLSGVERGRLELSSPRTGGALTEMADNMIDR